MEPIVEDFVVETEGYCFFCLNKINEIFKSDKPQVSADSFGSHNQRSVFIQSIQYLSRYLKLDMRKIFQGPIPQHLFAKVERSRLKVELCSECSNLNDKLSDLFQQLEKIQLEIAFRLNSFSCKIIDSDKFDKLTNIKEKFKSQKLSENESESNVDLLDKLDIAQVLREELNSKYESSLMKSGISFPQVKLEKILKWNKISKTEADKRDSESLQNIPRSDYVKLEEIYCPVKSEVLESTEYDENLDELTSFDDTWQSPSPSPSSSSPSSPSETKSSKYYFKTKKVSKTTDKVKVNKFSSQDKKLQSSSISIPSPIKSGGERSKHGSIAENQIVNPKNGNRQCRLCSKEYSRFSNFGTHFRSIHMKLSYTCPVCRKSFVGKREYERHYQAIHLCIRFLCKICYKSYSRKHELDRHLKRMH